MAVIDIVIVLVFLGLTFVVGSFFYKWVGDPDDFMVAGRKLTPFILAAVIAATNVNLYSFIGQAGVAYKHGIAILWQTWTGNMAIVFSGLFIIPIMRRLRVKTIPEFLERRYDKRVRTLVGVLWIFRLAFWLGVVLYTAVVAAQAITGIESFAFWIFVFAIVAIVYTVLGGMWAIAFTDVIQFVFMLVGALIVLPMAMAAVGWMPGLIDKLPEHALTLVREEGTYNWKFILAIFLLGIQWASVDQGLLQRAFGAESTRTVAKGLVLAGIITTPFALLWNLPGLAAAVLYPGLENADQAIPILLADMLPSVVLGLVLCGLISSQLSTISGNLNGVATLFTNDIYESLRSRKATNKEVLMIARIMTGIVGIFMIGFAFLVPMLGGAVEAYLTVIGIMDMPLFIVAIVYGLLWKRATSTAALVGYLSGAAAGIIGKFFLGFDFNSTTFLGAAVALIVTPLVSMITKPESIEKLAIVWRAKTISDEEETSGDVYHIIPKTLKGRLAMTVFASGFILFLIGVFMGSGGFAMASWIAVIGMVIYFVGGLIRVYAE
ncbi:MAG: sodium:solute symporter family protein [Candidatus Marinimicrobia bacterium]|nr:sodium:solute symporter family protein [Candidatus Neomarinimicrobiota bacterium]